MGLKFTRSVGKGRPCYPFRLFSKAEMAAKYLGEKLASLHTRGAVCDKSPEDADLGILKNLRLLYTPHQ
jgi:hypothetical protein